MREPNVIKRVPELPVESTKELVVVSPNHRFWLRAKIYIEVVLRKTFRYVTASGTGSHVATTACGCVPLVTAKFAGAARCWVTIENSVLAPNAT